VIEPAFAGLYNVYDYHLKNVKPEHVTVRRAELPDSVLERIKALSRRIVRALDLKDAAAIQSPRSAHQDDRARRW
jgi:D-alanine-D-alanine ligase-like ATP-grasp enzyme